MRGNVFIISSKSKISKNGNILVIDIDDERKRIPFGAIENVFVFGNPQISTQILKALTKEGKNIYFFNRFGKLQCITISEYINSNIRLRYSQYMLLFKLKNRVILTKELLRRKISITSHFVKKISNNQKTIKKLEKSKEKWKELLLTSKNIHQLIGLDGNIMNFIFSVLKENISEELEFSKRNYYPPTDPVNSLLSIVFSVVYSLLIGWLLGKNLDPYLGFMHKRYGNHATLASDFIELLRPYLIYKVFTYIKDFNITKKQFKFLNSGCYPNNELMFGFLQYTSDNILKNKKFLEKILNPFYNYLKEFLLSNCDLPEEELL